MSAQTSVRALAAALLSAAVGAAVLAAAGCGDDERVDPVGGGGGGTTGTTDASASSGATTAASSGAGGEAPVDPIRTVFTRDPFGNVAETRNLLWDGDFEWESAFADQYGWLQGQTASLTARHVGPECRSGLKCGVLGDDLIGIAFASADHDLYTSVWIRPGDGSCTNVGVTLFGEGVYDDALDAQVPAVASTPDDSGWCHYEATAPQRNDKTYLYISSDAAEEALVDDVVVREVSPEESRRVARLPYGAPDAATFAKLEAGRAVIRKWRGPHEGEPNPARDAAERWRRGEGHRRYVAAPQVLRGLNEGGGSR